MIGGGPLARVFEPFALRRRAGQPTPLVLVGDAIVRAWVAWLGERPLLRVPSATPEEVAAEYLSDPRGGASCGPRSGSPKPPPRCTSRSPRRRPRGGFGGASRNRALDVPFGNRPLEIDLACPSLRLAVEVDGYFHFRDADAYRRDRRKDIELQRQGYFVVRVLAEDVMARLEAVVAVVHREMEFLGDGTHERREG